MEAGFPEDLTYEFRGAIDDLWLAIEIRGGGDEAGQLHDPAYVVQAAGFCRGEGVQRAEAGFGVLGYLAQGLFVLGRIVDQGVPVVQNVAGGDLAHDDRVVAGADGIHDLAVQVGQAV